MAVKMPITVSHQLIQAYASMSMNPDEFARNYQLCSDWPDEFRTRLIEHRGGCGCNAPPYNPPCSNCVNDLTYDECVDLGYIIDAYGRLINLDEEWPTEPVMEVPGKWIGEKFIPDKPYEPDVFKTNDEVMAAVRAMCS